MKRFSKIISILLTLVLLLSATTALAGAASACPTGRVVYCAGGSCKDIQQLLKQCRNGNCSMNDLLKAIGSYCPDGNCSTYTPSAQPSQPTAQQTAPTESQQTAPTPTETQQAAPALTDAQTSEFRTAYENEVVRLVNAERAKYDLPALSADSGALSVAHIRAKEIVKSFSHTRPDGRSCFTAAADMGVSYRSAGENIAYGYRTPAQVVSGWMNSDGHRKNILSSSFTKIGVGCYEYNGVLYWSQFFIG